ncbi:MAG: chemotaxis response regulator protein-glutamate methylesterase [Chlorobia bacterium]|nr:chemotaxis response regulator protein-glutamate methylesterase [Fimbriimonadaceae bacterium]
MIKTRILIVDDSPLLRQVLVDMLAEEDDLVVVGIARDGLEAVALAKELKPDVITLDVEMPRMSGLEALAAIMREAPTRVIMVSTKTTSGAAATIGALEKGAIDFVCKPRSGSFMALREVHQELVAKIRGAGRAVIGIRTRSPIRAAAPARCSDKIVLIASSTGGPKALMCLFETLPKGWQVPILIVQHMPVGFTASLAARLDRVGAVPCREAVDGDRLQTGLALVAPGGQYMAVDHEGRISLSNGPHHQLAADHLFESAAKQFGAKCLAAVLTGAGTDGALGSLEIRKSGGVALGESESTCTVYEMPRAAQEMGGTSGEFPINEIGHALVATSAGRLKGAA